MCTSCLCKIEMFRIILALPDVWWKYNIKTELKDMGYEGDYWIHLAWDRVQCRVLVNTTMNTWGSQKMRNFTSWANYPLTDKYSALRSDWAIRYEVSKGYFDSISSDYETNDAIPTTTSVIMEFLHLFLLRMTYPFAVNASMTCYQIG